MTRFAGSYVIAFLILGLLLPFGEETGSLFTSGPLVNPLDSTEVRERAAVELGRFLFYDPILSRDSTVSCSSCHQQSLAFTDGRTTSVGIRDRIGIRNAPSLVNVKNRPYLLLDGVNPSLEAQIQTPIQEHAEFDFHILLIVERLKRNPQYVRLSEIAYDHEFDHRTVFNSIASFERTIVGSDSPYDRFLRGDSNALTESQKRGKKLFFETLYCGECHAGNDLTNDALLNNGLYTVYADLGRMRLTEKEADRAVFKVPTIRNIAITAPYMHNGSMTTLDAVLDHYMSGGKDHPAKGSQIIPFRLSDRQRTDLLAFLESLTDSTVLSNPTLSSPFQ